MGGRLLDGHGDNRNRLRRLGIRPKPIRPNCSRPRKRRRSTALRPCISPAPRAPREAMGARPFSEVLVTSLRPDSMQGGFTVSVDGFRADVKVISKGGVFTAELPFYIGRSRRPTRRSWTRGPAELMDPQTGLTSLIGAASDLRMGPERRRPESSRQRRRHDPGQQGTCPSRPLAEAARGTRRTHRSRRRRAPTGPLDRAFHQAARQHLRLDPHRLRRARGHHAALRLLREAGRRESRPAASRRSRVAVLIAAADTYVVVVALPSIMGGAGLGLDRLQRSDADSERLPARLHRGAVAP